MVKVVETESEMVFTRVLGRGKWTVVVLFYKVTSSRHLLYNIVPIVNVVLCTGNVVKRVGLIFSVLTRINKIKKSEYLLHLSSK